MSAFATEFVARLERGLDEVRDPEAAVGMRAYMRDQFAFVGVRAPGRVQVCRAAIDDLPTPDQTDLETVARELWPRDERDYQYAVVWLLRRNVRRLDATFIETARLLITTKPWWDTIDELAQNVVGPLVLTHPELVAVMDEWIEDDDFWLARTAILHQDRYKARTDPERLFRYCTRRAGDTEFFVRKAIGWALREYSKTDADAVRAFVAEHHDELSGLSRREALKWLDRRAARAASADPSA